ncbi:hypothetical protein D3C74_486460 [compost metagenome]
MAGTGQAKRLPVTEFSGGRNHFGCSGNIADQLGLLRLKFATVHNRISSEMADLTGHDPRFEVK